MPSIITRTKQKVNRPRAGLAEHLQGTSNGNGLHQADRKHLELSGLTPATLRENRVRSAANGIVFPYSDLLGQFNGFCRVRLSTPKGKQKYHQAKGSEVRAYFPQQCLAEVRDGISDIYVTEGEKKALLLAQMGVPAIGLGGVFSAYLKGTETLIPDLRGVPWNGRRVVIVFDYDPKPVTRANVECAIKKLAAALLKIGAGSVYKVKIPPGPGNTKNAIDDYIVRRGEKVFERLVENAELVSLGSEEGALQTRRYSEIERREVDWLWDQRFAKGKINMLHGNPDLGKTWLGLYVIACVTTGRDFCDGAKCEMGEALYVTAEDDPEDTIGPRLDALGADSSKVHNLDAVIVKGKERQLALDVNIPALDRWLGKHPAVTLVELDPVASYLGKVNANSNSEVRAVLDELGKVIVKHHVAFIGMDHLSKSPMTARLGGIGSVAWTAGPRTTWQLRADPDDAERRLLLKGKNNLATKPVHGLAFRLDNQAKGVLVWEKEAVMLSVDDVAVSDGSTPRKEAKEWLEEQLKNGPVASKNLEEQAKRDGMCWRTVGYAKKELGTVSKLYAGVWSTMRKEDAEKFAEIVAKGVAHFKKKVAKKVRP